MKQINNEYTNYELYEIYKANTNYLGAMEWVLNVDDYEATRRDIMAWEKSLGITMEVVEQLEKEAKEGALN